MLSGLTSQLGGLIGGAKKSQQPPEETSGDTDASVTAAITANPDAGQDGATSSSGGANNKPGAGNESVLSSVRNHIPSWLGGGKLAAKEEVAMAAGDIVVPEAKLTDSEDKGHITPDKESDASSATGGADSDNQQVSEGEGEAGSPGANVAGLDKVKNLGNLLFSTIKGAGQKIKETSILGEFQREHESFLKSKGIKGEAVAPWVGHTNEEALKEEILSLSTDRRNFVRSPPTGVAFQWDYEEMAPVAKAILKDDPNLENMRYQLVPKKEYKLLSKGGNTYYVFRTCEKSFELYNSCCYQVISEENFWRNYFYRVSLLKESLSEDEPKKKRDNVDSDDEDAALEKELNEELRSFEVVGGASGAGNTSTIDDKEIDSLLDLK